MRTLEELYTLLYTSYVHGFTDFICIHMHGLYGSKQITEEELSFLLSSFNKNRPTPELHPLFCNHDLYSRSSWNWFGTGEYSRQVRREFLNYLIKNHV